jgi:hypothetical protein
MTGSSPVAQNLRRPARTPVIETILMHLRLEPRPPPKTRACEPAPHRQRGLGTTKASRRPSDGYGLVDKSSIR